MEYQPTSILLLLTLASLFLFTMAAPPHHDLDQRVVNVRRARNLDLDIEIAIQPANQLYAKTMCSLTLHSKPNATDMRVTAAKWLNNETLLLANYDEFEGGDRNVSFSMIRISDCSSGPIDEHLVIVTSRVDFKTLVIRDSAALLTGDEFGLDWPENGTRVQAASDNLLLVQFHNDDGTLKVRLYNSSSSYKELLSMPNSRDINVMSHKLAICWPVNLSYDGGDRVTCSIYNANGELQTSMDMGHGYVEKFKITRVKYTEFMTLKYLTVDSKTMTCLKNKYCGIDVILVKNVQI